MIALVLATDMEAAPLLDRLECGRARGPGPTGALPPQGGPATAIRVTTFGDLGLLVAVVGMGKASARAGMIRLLEIHRPAAVVNVGIAGALTDRTHVHAIYRVDHALDWPGDLRSRVRFASGWFDDLPSRTLVTSDEPVFDTVLRRDLARLGDMVDMEGASIGAVCAAARVPCAAIKGISDLAGDGDRAMLRGNLVAACEKLADLVAERCISG